MSESFASMEDRGVPEISAEEEAALTQRLSPEREAKIRELCRGAARMAPRGWMATAQELLAELAAVRAERDAVRQQIAEDFKSIGARQDTLAWGEAYLIARDGLCVCRGGSTPCDDGEAAR